MIFQTKNEINSKRIIHSQHRSPMFALKLKLMTKKQATKNKHKKAKRHQKASNLTKSLMDGEASEVLIIGPNGFFYHRRPDGTIITKRNAKLRPKPKP